MKTPKATAAPDPLGRTAASRYDGLNRLAEVTDPAGYPIGYGYDGRSNLAQVTDPRGLVTQYSYDLAGNLTEKTDARSQTTSYGYDALNRVTAIGYRDEAIQFAYDQPAGGEGAIGRLTQVSDGSGSTAYSYDRQGRITTKTQTVSNGSTLAVEYSHDAQGRLEGKRLTNSTYRPIPPYASLCPNSILRGKR